MTKDELLEILSLGEDYYTEFKQKVSASLTRELVAMANASGGRIFIGIDDSNKVKGVEFSNSVHSLIQDLANNCDPSVGISIETFENIIIVHVKEGANKPYSCSDGFYLRVGPNSQKLSRDEIIQFLKKRGESEI
ncbi:MAG TPA: ATP-binding protein [Bacteroidales bacterium]|nr:ATP-binding protein [Bacteroidales bacterium]